MFNSSLSRLLAVVCLSAASALVWAQDPAAPLPVTRLAGESAGQTPAPAPRRPQPLPGLPVTSLDETSHRADLDAQQRLTVSFARPTAIQDVLFLLARGTAFSVAMDPSITGTFVGELRDVTLRQAIGSVLAPNALAYDVDGTVIRVFPQRAQTRIFDLDLLNVERAWQHALSAGDATTLTARVPASDPIDEVTAGIATVLSDAGRVHVDRHAGIAQVTDYPDRLDRVALYLEALHARGSRQVRLQARVLEVTLKAAPAVDWKEIRSRLGLSDTAGAGCVVDPAALQAALAAQGDVRVVSAPEFVAINNEPAIVRTATTGSAALALTVIAQISEDGVVQLSLSPSWTRTTGSRATRDAMAIVEADTTVRVMDGATAMITGLLRSDELPDAATPGAGSESRTAATREVVVLVTPTVVNAGARIATR